jgi:hypothetical protein
MPEQLNINASHLVNNMKEYDDALEAYSKPLMYLPKEEKNYFPDVKG